MPLGERGDLRQVRDRDHLRAGAEALQRTADRVRGLAADARVDLVEDHRRPAADRGDRERDAGQLAAGGRLGDGRERQARVRAHEERDAVAPRRPGLGLGEVDAELALVHADVSELGGDGRGERAGSGGACGSELLGDPPPPLLRRRDGALRRLERVDAVREPVELGARDRSSGQQLFVRAGPEAPLRLGDAVELRLDLLQPPRLGLERGGERSEVARRLAEPDLDVAELLRRLGELRGEPLHLAEGALRVRDEGCRALAILGGERGARDGGRVRELGHVPEPLSLGAQVLLGRRLEAVGRGDERAEVLEPVALRRRPSGELGVAAPRGGELAPGAAGLGAARRLLLADEAVEDVELVRGPSEAPLLELAGHGDQALAHSGQVLAGRGPSPRVGAGAAVGEDAAREHEPVLVRGPELGETLQTLLVEEPGREVELGLDVCLVRAGPDEARVGFGAEEEPDRLGEDRLARPGLAGDRVEARPELEVGLADEDEVLDAEAPQHARMVRAAPVSDEASEAAVSRAGRSARTAAGSGAQLPPGVRSAP